MRTRGRGLLKASTRRGGAGRGAAQWRRLDQHEARCADRTITNAIDRHVQAEQCGDDDDGATGTLGETTGGDTGTRPRVYLTTVADGLVSSGVDTMSAYRPGLGLRSLRSDQEEQ